LQAVPQFVELPKQLGNVWDDDGGEHNPNVSLLYHRLVVWAVDEHPPAHLVALRDLDIDDDYAALASLVGNVLDTHRPDLIVLQEDGNLDCRPPEVPPQLDLALRGELGSLVGHGDHALGLEEEGTRQDRNRRRGRRSVLDVGDRSLLSDQLL